MKPPDGMWIEPDWNAPARVRAGVTTRAGGASVSPYATMNLASHVGDDPIAVQENRNRLRDHLRLPNEPVWLRQVHGTVVVDAGTAADEPEADGAYTRQSGVVCAVLTADCLPVFLCDRAGSRVAVLHAGWRGLASGILEAGVKALGCAGTELMAWLGPAISVEAFEVGPEVREAMVRHDPEAGLAFHAASKGKWRADLYQLAGQRLRAQGVQNIQGGQFCTFREKERFYSYRRDGVTGRMASLIWLAGP